SAERTSHVPAHFSPTISGPHGNRSTWVHDRILTCGTLLRAVSGPSEQASQRTVASPGRLATPGQTQSEAAQERTAPRLHSGTPGARSEWTGTRARVSAVAGQAASTSARPD